MKAVAIYTAGACCGAAAVGTTAFLSGPSPGAGRTAVWRNSASARLGTAAARSRAPRASVCNPTESKAAGGGAGAGADSAGGTNGSGARGAVGGKHRSTLLSNLDLKPAYRLFDTVPPPAASEAARKSDDVDLDVNGKAPYGECSEGGE